MNISDKINQYIENSKINRNFIKWDKAIINVFVSPIVNPSVQNKDTYYYAIEKAINIWNKILKNNNIPHSFNLTKTSDNADVIIHWVKVGRVNEGMCKYPSIINNIIKKVSIDIGLENKFSPKNTTQESIFFAIMHEFGHSLGLGHGVEIDDLMYVPHQKNITEPSINDLYVLKQIYSE